MNRVQLCGQLMAGPDIRIKKNGAMVAHIVLETYSAWQAELGAWQYSTNLHHITVYREDSILFLQDDIAVGDQICVQGILTYDDNNEVSRNKKRNVHIIVPRKNGLIFQLKENQTLPKTNQIRSFMWEHQNLWTANENKSPKNPNEIE